MRQSVGGSHGPRVLLFDVMADGHGVKNWTALLTSPAFRELTIRDRCDVRLLIPPLLRARLESELAGRVELAPLCDESPDGLEDFHTSAGRRRAIRTLGQALRRERYDACLILYGDSLLFYLPLLKLLHRRGSLGALFFRPIIHYRARGYSLGDATWAQYGRPLLKNVLLLAFLKVRLLSLALFQDDGGVEWFRRRGVPVLWCPTPPIDSTDEPVVRAASARMRFTLFGSISRRKGVFKILEAWTALPAALRERTQLRLIGRIEADDRNEVLAAVGQMGDGEVEVDDRFVANREIRDVYAGTDVMLLPYSGLHVGTSGILVQCALWDMPVLVEDLGWVGATTSRLGLGRTVRFRDVEAVQRAVTACVERPDALVPGPEARAFGQGHLPAIYGEQIVAAVRQLVSRRTSA